MPYVPRLEGTLALSVLIAVYRRQRIPRLSCAAMYERYERQLLQTSLDQMKDVVWCPRCQYPALHDGESNGKGAVLATCGQCTFCFCSECR